MGLKQSIVVVNEYTVKSRSSGKASRGATPGDYVTRYMARELATETLAPIRRQRTDDFIMRYMAREAATEVAHSSREIKQRMSKAQGNGGVSFGYGSVSLSDQELRDASKDIQKHFDNGSTVLKTVLSFDQEYLREHGLIPKDFQCEQRGDYRGQLDQMKLRMAVMHGLDRMNRAQYDDLRYVAVIQVDTEHVHCHLAMVDAGEGRLAKDGTQRGKIDDAGKSLMRRGIDSWLDEQQKVAHLSSAVGYERRNVVSFVKKWAHQQMVKEATPQFLLACLPQDRRMWRAGTNRTEMRKPNMILREMIQERLAEPGSPMSQVMDEIHQYADTRREKEGLSPGQWATLVDDGREKVVESCMNGVYTMLRSMPQDLLTERTPMLDAMSLDYDEMAQRAHDGDEDEMVDFGFRLRSFSSRLDHHREQREQYHQQARQWESADDAGLAAVRSRALYELYLEEEEYHAMCAAKYQSFLRFAPPTDQWYDQWNEVAEYGEKLAGLQMMRGDQSLARMKNGDEAEMRGQEIYGQYGGHFLTEGAAGKKILDSRLARMRETYEKKVSDLKVEMASQGLNLQLERDEDTGKDEAVITAGPEYEFEDVKALDLHHMGYDFSQDVPVGELSLRAFTERARTRRQHLDEAREYLEDTEQLDAVMGLPIADISAMEALALQLEAEQVAVLPSRLAELNRERERVARSRTVRLSVRLDDDLGETMARSAQETVSELVIDESREAPVRDRSESGLE